MFPLMLLAAGCGLSDSPEKAVTNYLDAGSSEERFETICPSPQLTLDTFKDVYKDVDLQSIEVLKTKVVETLSDVRVRVSAKYKSGEAGERNNANFVVQKPIGGGKWCVHWLSQPQWIGSSDAAWNDGVSTFTYLGVAEDWEYFNWQYSSAFTDAPDHYYSFAIAGRSLYGYIPRTHPAVNDLRGKGQVYVRAEVSYPYRIPLLRRQGGTRHKDTLLVTNLEVISFPSLE
jgi:hypothetical protein